MLSRGWLSESQLAGRWLHGSIEDWAQLNESLLPLLVRGLVHSNCDLEGRLYFSLTYGPAWSFDLEPLPSPLPSIESARTSMDELYLQTANERWTAIQSGECSDLIIPIPASCWYPLAQFETLMDMTIPNWKTELSMLKGGVK